METWANFSQTDIVLAVFGAIGFASVVATLVTASSTIDSQEIKRKVSSKK